MHTSKGNIIKIICEKVIISGKEIEHYRYLEKPILRGYKRKKRKEKTEPKEQTKKSGFSVYRTITEIRRILGVNPQLIKHLILTSKITEVKEANKQFNLFTQRIKDKFPEFQYFAVIEFQKDIDFFGKVKPKGGAVHYHLLCQLRKVKSKKLEEIWGQGFIKIKRKKEADDMRSYLSKYFWKDMKDKRLFGKKKFFCSQYLERPAEIINEEANFFMKDSDKNFELIKEQTFKNDHRGDINYRLFNFKNYNP